MTETTKYTKLIRKNLSTNSKGMFREAGGALPFPFLTPGSDPDAGCQCRWAGSCAHSFIPLEKKSERNWRRNSI